MVQCYLDLSFLLYQRAPASGLTAKDLRPYASKAAKKQGHSLEEIEGGARAHLGDHDRGLSSAAQASGLATLQLLPTCFFVTRSHYPLEISPLKSGVSL